MSDTPKQTDTQKKLTEDVANVQTKSTTNSDGGEDLSVYGSSVIKPIRTFALDAAEAKKKSGNGKTESKDAPAAKQNQVKPEAKAPPGATATEPIPVIDVARGSFMPQGRVEVENQVKRKEVPKPQVKPTPKPQVKEVPVPKAPDNLPTGEMKKPQNPVKPQVPKPTKPKSLHSNQLAELKKQVSMSEVADKKRTAEDAARAKATIKTLEQDAKERVREQGLSQISIAAEEQKRRSDRGFTPLPKEESPFLKNVALGIVSIVLVVSGIGVAYYFFSKSQEPGNIDNSQVEVIFADRKKEINVGGLSGQSLLQTLEDERKSTESSSNAVVELLLSESQGLSGVGQISANEFVSRLDNAPDSLERSIRFDYMLGVHPEVDNAPFLILKTNSFDVTFAAMLEWEQNLQQSLTPLFGPVLITKPSELTIGDNKPTEFHDVVVRNKDTRLLRGSDGQVVLMYGFSNTETVIITTNEATFFEIFKRLSTSRSSS